MKKTIAFVGILFLFLPSMVFSDSFVFRIGYFMPKAPQTLDSLWGVEFDQMTYGIEDFRGPIYGFGYERFLTKQLSFSLTVDFYGREKAGYYYDWVGYAFDEGDFAFPYEYYDGDFGIGHSFKISVTPVQLSLRLAPLGRRGRFVPYVGGGAGMYFWRVRMRGEIVDFSDDSWVYDDEILGEVQIYPIEFVDARDTGKMTIGYHAFGGIQIPIGYRMTLDGEARYNFIKGQWKSDSNFMDFDPFDMSGLVLSVGFSYWF